jgi:hypothetical protein
VDEQVEEEANVDAVVQDLRRVEGVPGRHVHAWDRELGQRAPGAAEDTRRIGEPRAPRTKKQGAPG